MTRLRLAAWGLYLAAATACGGGGAGGGGAPVGLFQAPASFPLGVERDPTSVAVADFNRDGRDDIAVANGQAGTIAVVLGSGTGSFSAPVEFGLGSQQAPTALAAGDFNRDGRPDLAVLVSELVPTGEGPELFHRVLVLDGHRTAGYAASGPAAGDFTVGAIVTIGSGYFPSAFVAADLDRDGDLDLAATTIGGDDVQVILGNGDGTFASPVQVLIESGFDPSAIAAANLDRDVNLDLAVTSGANGKVAILRGLGGGSFAPPTFVTVALGASLSSVAVVQIDRAATPDLAVGDRSNQKLVVLRGQGSGSGSPGFEIASEHALPMPPSGVVTGDFDRDGLGDVAVATGVPAGSPPSVLQVCLGRDDATVAAPVPFESGGVNPVALALGDFDRNGSLDVVLANGGDNSFSVLLGASHARRPDAYYVLSYAQLQTYPARGTFVHADITRDGRPDLVVAEKYQPAIEILLGGDGTQFSPARRFPSSGIGNPSALVVEDFDSDGDADVIVGFAFSNRLVVFAGTDSDPVVATAPDISTFTTFGTSSFSTTDIATGDVDRDGVPDLVVADANARRLYVALGNGNLTFGVATSLPTSNVRFEAVALADVDADGDLDVVAVKDNGEVQTYRGDGLGAFAPPLGSSTTTFSYHVHELLVRDVSGDGRADVVLASDTGTLVALGLGNGTFASLAAAGFPAGPSADVVAADLDLDGAVDLLPHNYGTVYPVFGNALGTLVQDFSIYLYNNAGSGSAGIVTGDWDRDGRPDAALLDENSFYVSIARAYDY